MAFINSPNMGLPIPVVGQEPGPNYATDVNNSLTLIDQHTHVAGSGVQITPAAININSALVFNNNQATGLASLTLVPQSLTPSINSIYESGVDLFYVDGLGNNIQITALGGIAGSPGSISNLTSPASASYVAGSKTFVWQSGVSLAANMDFGAAVMRNITPNSTNALTLQPPAALASNYSITLPTLPASQKIMTLDNTGIMAAPYTVDGSTITISANVIGVPAQGIGTTQIADGGVTTVKLADASVTAAKLAALNYAISNTSGNYTTLSGTLIDIPSMAVSLGTTGRPVEIRVVSDGSGNTASWGTASGGSTIAILRDNVVIARQSILIGAGQGMNVPTSSISFFDLAPAGSHLYKLQYTATGSNFNFSWSQLVAYQIE